MSEHLHDAPKSSLVRELDMLSRETERTILKSEERLKATKGRFNLFTTLLKVHDENRLHSRFIHFLLNPHESHDCGDLFLRSFAEAICGQNNLSPIHTLIDDNFINGRTEQPTDQGRRIDIYLEFKGGIIALENKIHASEQPEQIQHYAKFIGSFKKKPFLLYLTPHGEDSQTANGATYTSISYEEHILKWIEICLSKTYEFVNVNIALQQYRNVVRELLGRNHYMEDVQAIKEHIKNCPNFLKHFSIISQSVEELYNEAWRKILGDLLSELRNHQQIKSMGDWTGDTENPRSAKGDTWVKIETTNAQFYLGPCKTGGNRIVVTMYRGDSPGNFKADDRTEANHVYQKLKNDERFANKNISAHWWGVFYYVEACPGSLEDPAFALDLHDETKRKMIVKESINEIEDLMNSADQIVAEYRSNVG